MIGFGSAPRGGSADPVLAIALASAFIVTPSQRRRPARILTVDAHLGLNAPPLMVPQDSEPTEPPTESLVVPRAPAATLQGAARAHEVRNVLTAVRGWVALARSGDPEMARRAWSVVDDGVERAVRLLDGASLGGAPHRFSLDEVANRAADLLEATCIAQGVVLRREVSPVEAYGDEEKTVQIVLNFGLNALQAMRDGGGTITVSVEADGPCARMAVTDDGPGMEPDVAARVFDAFFTTKSADAGPRRGVGLAVCQALAESMGATVEVSSVFGAGSTFSLCLQTTPRPRSFSDVPSTEPVLRAGLRVLVVDDEVAIRELLDVALSLRGARVLTCGELPEARRLAMQGEVDVALVDESLGLDHSGSALLAELAQHAPAVGRVLMTGAAETAGLAATASAALVRKPFLLEDVVHAIAWADRR